MRFGDTLQKSIYPPWKEHYIAYSKLKLLLRETDDGSDAERESSTNPEGEGERQWTEHDESRFVDELINVQLEKVHSFQLEMTRKLKERTAACENKLEKLMPVSEEEKEKDKGKGKDDGTGSVESHPFEGIVVQQDKETFTEEETQKILKDTLKELDEISFLINQLQKFRQINFTGFFKAAKKHDRKQRGADTRSKGKNRAKDEGGLMVRPLLQVRLSALEFNKEDWNPLLYRLSAMYAFIRSMVERDQEGQSQAKTDTSSVQGQSTSSGKYSSYKFWIHLDNYLEVKTSIVRRLPMLIYNPNHSKQIDVHVGDPTINSLYFDNSKFELYTNKVEKKPGATSLRLRWYGQLASRPEIFLERKTMQSTEKAMIDAAALGPSTGNSDDFEGAVEERITLKEKYVEGFIRGEYSMGKTIQKMRDRRDKSDEDVEKYEALVQDFQSFIKEHDLQPMLRAVYTRTAFQIPGDDQIRVSLDTNLALIREDSLDPERPCREPDEWHRKDIGDAQMEYPFSSIRKGEIIRFPYALLEIKVRDTLPPRQRQWINELMDSHLVRETPRFSKFVHGVSTLFEDHVNVFPFWLGEVDQDIRKDPKSAFKEEQEKKAKIVEAELAVSFKLGGFGKFGTSPYGTSPRPPLEGRPESIKSLVYDEAEGDSPQAEHADSSEGEESEYEGLKHQREHVKGLAALFPTFSTSRYGRRHRQGQPDDVILPPGVRKPDVLLMHSTPVNVEPKVWLANQRTFIKWEHISVLLATLSLGLYNSAGEKNSIARMLAVVYTLIAIFTGIWGYWVYITRCKLIRQRSGKDFDQILGPFVIGVGLAVALILNFAFKWHAAIEKHKQHEGANPGNNGTTVTAEWAQVSFQPVVNKVIEEL